MSTGIWWEVGVWNENTGCFIGVERHRSRERARGAMRRYLPSRVQLVRIVVSYGRLGHETRTWEFQMEGGPIRGRNPA